MPTVARFDGIAVKMYVPDHPPPHFHIEAAGERAQVAIETLDVIAGALSVPVHRKVREWARPRQDALWECWRRCESYLPPGKLR